MYGFAIIWLFGAAAALAYAVLQLHSRRLARPGTPGRVLLCTLLGRATERATPCTARVRVAVALLGCAMSWPLWVYLLRRQRHRR